MPPPTPRHPVPFQPSPAPIPSLFRSVGQPMAHHALWVTTSRVRHGKRQRNSPGVARAAGNRVSDSRAVLPLGVEDLVHDLGILDAAMIRCPQYMRQRSGIHTRLVTAQGRFRHVGPIDETRPEKVWKLFRINHGCRYADTRTRRSSR